MGGGGGATGYAILKKGLGGEGRGLVPFLILRANLSLTGWRDLRDVWLGMCCLHPGTLSLYRTWFS